MPNIDHSKYAEYVIQKWLAKIKALNIHHHGDLASSFIAEVIRNADGDVERIQFLFNFYGTMVDMGVGRGITLEDIGVGNRHPKKWFTPIIYQEVRALSRLLAKDLAFKFNKQTMESITSMLDKSNKT